MPNQGPFLPTTDTYDVQTIYSLDINSDEFKEFLVRLRQSVNNVLLALNAKDSGFYTQFETICGQQYFPNPALTSLTPQTPVYRAVFREVVLFGPLAMGVNTKAHNISVTTSTTFTRIYGVVNDITNFSYLPLPYVNLAGNEIQIDVDATNVTITTAVAMPTYTINYVIVEYLKT